ncbi:MAG: glycosyltransferase family 9 protein [Verrucomicrobiota bacterium]
MLKPSSLGDIVHTLPAVAAIKRSFPKVAIDWLVNTEWTPILEGSPVIDKVIAFPRRQFRGLSGLWKGRSWAKEIFQNSKYDLALDFQGLLRTALLARYSGAEKIVGFAEAREGAVWFYGEVVCVQRWQQLHAIDRNRQIPCAFGIETLPIEFPLPEGVAPNSPPDLDSPALLLHPFSRGVGKSLSVEEVRELCDSLSPVPVWLVGVSDEETAACDWPENTINFLNRTDLKQLIWLIRKAAWTVSVDSGPMHLAAGLSERVLSIHTWSDPLMVGPYRKNSWIWRAGQIRQVQTIEPGEFPEDRKARKHFAQQDRILSADEVNALSKFLLPHLTT